MLCSSDAKIAVIGLGYVGLPLAVEFGKTREVIGYDINHDRIAALQCNHDATMEIEENELIEAKYLRFTSSLNEIENCNTYIITVPTPIDNNKKPNLKPLINASEAVGKVLKNGDIVIYESTSILVPEEDCACLGNQLIF